MTITNKHNLPAPLVNILAKREYSRGNSVMSVTQLINAPRVVALRTKHAHLIEEDVADRFWALMGTNIHKILEDGADADHLTEERLFIDVEGWRISGQIDVQQSKEGANAVKIHDWKFTSVWNVMNPKPEWEEQLNLYAYLVTKVKNQEVSEANVTAILRDWRKSDFQKKGAPYPPAAMVNVPIKLWTFEQQEAYLRHRVLLHQDASTKSDWGEELPFCTDEERWLRTITRGPTKGQTQAIRCENDYCGVAQWCSQFKGSRSK